MPIMLLNAFLIVLKKHLGLELETIEFYQKHVEQMHDPEVRKVLLQLINESIGHANGFRKILYKRSLGIDYESQGTNEVELSQILEFGMREEREMRLDYEKALPYISDENYKQFLEQVIKDERRHEQMLKIVYEKMRK